MKRTVRAVVLAVAVMAMMVPAVSADGNGGWGARTFTCDAGSDAVDHPAAERVRARDRPVPRGRIRIRARAVRLHVRRHDVPVEAARGPAWSIVW